MMRKGRTLRWWTATVVGGLGVCLGVVLGMWQLERAAQKTRWQAAQQAQAGAAPLQASVVQAQLAQHGDSLPAQWSHHPITLQGHWLAAHTVYLDNRQMQGRPGFYVFTPLQLADGAVVLVQRGWIARNFQDRLALQPITTPEGPVAVNGQLAGAPARLYALEAGDMPDPAAAHIRLNLDLAGYAQSSGLPLWPATVVQTDAASDGLLRAWPQPGNRIATHYGYAFQWFAIAAVLAAMLLWFQILRPARAARQLHAATLS